MPEIITRAEARSAGLKWYFTGNPCQRGHVSQRYTSAGMCRACSAEKYAAGRYFTGKPCHRGHVSERRGDGYCLACKSIDTMIWRRRHAAEINRRKLEKRKRAMLALKALEELGIEI